VLAQPQHGQRRIRHLHGSRLREHVAHEETGTHRVLEREGSFLARAQHGEIPVLLERPSRGRRHIDEGRGGGNGRPPRVNHRLGAIGRGEDERAARHALGDVLERRIAEIESLDHAAAALPRQEDLGRGIPRGGGHRGVAVGHRHDARAACGAGGHQRGRRPEHVDGDGDAIFEGEPRELGRRQGHVHAHGIGRATDRGRGALGS
jgi:hypothetical protein